MRLVLSRSDSTLSCASDAFLFRSYVRCHAFLPSTHIASWALQLENSLIAAAKSSQEQSSSSCRRSCFFWARSSSSAASETPASIASPSSCTDVTFLIVASKAVYSSAKESKACVVFLVQVPVVRFRVLLAHSTKPPFWLFNRLWSSPSPDLAVSLSAAVSLA